jgi:hypothetical protein
LRLIEQAMALQAKMPAAAEAGRADGPEGMLLIDLVNAIAGFSFCGFDPEPMLLGGGRQEAPDAVRLPIGRLHDLGQSRSLGPPDQFQDFRALLSARGMLPSFAGAGLAAFLLTLASFFGLALAFPRWAALWPWGAPFFWLAPFFERTRSGATVAPCSATAAALSLASVFVILIFLPILFLRLGWRMTIHHSGPLERQEKSECLRKDPSMGEHAAMQPPADWRTTLAGE